MVANSSSRRVALFVMRLLADLSLAGTFVRLSLALTEPVHHTEDVRMIFLTTPVDTESKHGPERTPISDPTLYRSLASGLQYLTFTRPNLSYVVQQICLYMHDPWEPHLAALKRILRYVQGTLQFGLQLYASSGSSLVAYFDVDWAGCPGTCRSTSGYCVFMGENLLSWPAKRQHTL
ncbi:ribonuclease H-like domain-containing protein [Tanacetum coccineum]